MNKKYVINFIDRAIAKEKSVVLTAKRDDITFPLPIDKKSLRIVRENIISGYTDDLERKDGLYKVIDIDFEPDYCKIAAEEKIKKILSYFKSEFRKGAEN